MDRRGRRRNGGTTGMGREFAVLVVGVIAGILIGQVVHFHHSGSSYGISIGTNTYSCGTENRGISCQVTK
jgi:hypothetical protein